MSNEETDAHGHPIQRVTRLYQDQRSGWCALVHEDPKIGVIATGQKPAQLSLLAREMGWGSPIVITKATPDNAYQVHMAQEAIARSRVEQLRAQSGEPTLPGTNALDKMREDVELISDVSQVAPGLQENLVAAVNEEREKQLASKLTPEQLQSKRNALLTKKRELEGILRQQKRQIDTWGEVFDQLVKDGPTREALELAELGLAEDTKQYKEVALELQGTNLELADLNRDYGPDDSLGAEPSPPSPDLNPDSSVSLTEPVPAADMEQSLDDTLQNLPEPTPTPEPGQAPQGELDTAPTPAPGYSPDPYGAVVELTDDPFVDASRSPTKEIRQTLAEKFGIDTTDMSQVQRDNLEASLGNYKAPQTAQQLDLDAIINDPNAPSADRAAAIVQRNHPNLGQNPVTSVKNRAGEHNPSMTPGLKKSKGKSLKPPGRR